MKVILDSNDITALFSDTNCVVVSEWDGGPATINKTESGEFYIVRWGEYEPCTVMLSVDSLVKVLSFTDGVVLHVSDYSYLHHLAFR
jgi:hypothetical protein